MDTDNGRCHAARATHERSLAARLRLSVGIAIAWLREFALARMLMKRAKRRRLQLLRRGRDGTLWVAGYPRSLALAWAAFLGKRSAGWHFWRVREFRGVFVVSRKTFWLPILGREFEFEAAAWPVYVLRPFEIAKETDLIGEYLEREGAAQGIEAAEPGETAKTGSTEGESPVAESDAPKTSPGGQDE